jgi:UDPglucose--hexose-1-phosphate uridylyltransferase
MLPKRHMSSFGSMEGRELEDLAFLLKVVLSKFYYGLGNPSFNYCIRTSPEGGESAYFHWYLSIVPRLTKAAGFELGSGMYVNTSLPESDAEILRDVEVSVS